jgi:hypothetical protein
LVTGPIRAITPGALGQLGGLAEEGLAVDDACCADPLDTIW